MKNKYLPFVLSMICGLLIWVFSPVLAGHEEPWDGSMTYYLLGMLIPSIIIAIVFDVKGWMVAAGFFLGQLVFVIVKSLSHPSPLIVIGVLFLAFYTLLSCGLPAAIIGKVKKQLRLKAHNN